jgi:hypothetical protein
MKFTPAQTEQELLEQYVGLATEKQFDVPDIIGNKPWNTDIDKGTISFGDDLVFKAQFLGSFSHSSETWLWIWANKYMNPPAQFIDHALQLKAYGEANNIDLLSVDTFAANNNDLHIIGSIASGMFDASCYLTVNYGAGTMLLTVEDDIFNKVEKDEQLRTQTTIGQMISNFDVNHRRAIINYLTAKGYTVEQYITNIRATKGTTELTCQLSLEGLLLSMEGSI